MDINERIVNMKNDLIILAQQLHDSKKDEIDGYKFSELQSNLLAFLEFIKKEMK